MGCRLRSTSSNTYVLLSVCTGRSRYTTFAADTSRSVFGLRVNAVMKKEQWSLKNRQTNDSKQQEGEEDAPVTLQEVCLQWLVRLLSFLAFAAGTRYILWRWSRIIATSYWLSLPFVICEGCLILLGSGKVTRRDKV